MPTYNTNKTANTDSTSTKGSAASKSSAWKPAQVKNMHRLLTKNIFQSEQFSAESTWWGWNNEIPINGDNYYIYSTPVTGITLVVNKDNGNVHFYDKTNDKIGESIGQINGAITDNDLVKVWNGFIDNGKKYASEHKLGGILDYQSHYFDFFN